LLAQRAVAEFGGQARFVSENYGDSSLAKRFGVTRYPAIFVDDVLVATPDDFGFYGRDAKREGGRYAPLKSAGAHQHFHDDLSRMIGLVLAGRKEDARTIAAPRASAAVAAFPPVTIPGLDGRSVAGKDLLGKVVLVELWATWCPPCRGTLGWLGDVKKRHGDSLEILALAIESQENDVRKLTGELRLPLFWAMGTPEIARAFGDVSAVPTLLLFDRQGRAAEAFYGAPPTLHSEAETAIARLLE
jgi:thiol-disulfide isomerase/thioredoxin